MRREMTVHYGGVAWDVTFEDFGDEIDELRVEANGSLQEISDFLTDSTITSIIDAIFERKRHGDGWPQGTGRMDV
jgi:hypothetical protein